MPYEKPSDSPQRTDPAPRFVTTEEGLRSFVYTCTCCGRQETGLPAIAYGSPDIYFGSSDEDKEQRFSLTSDQCIMDDEFYFVRCVLQIPILGTDETLEWGVWSSLSEQSFDAYQDYYDCDPPDDLPPFFGWLSTALSGYPDTTSLKCDVHLRGDNQRPLIELQENDHPLSIDQRNGISVERALELAEPVLKGMAH